jgi:hypothetical protein
VVEAEWAAETTHQSHVLSGPVEPIIETLLIGVALRFRGAHPASEQSHYEHDDFRDHHDQEGDRVTRRRAPASRTTG